MWAASKSHGVDLQDPRERRRHVLTLFSADWAVEWVRPLLPNTKMVGPILPEPAQALPADLQVTHPQCVVAVCGIQELQKGYVDIRVYGVVRNSWRPQVGGASLW